MTLGRILKAAGFTELPPRDEADREKWFQRIRKETIFDDDRAGMLADMFARREGWGDRFLERATPEAAGFLQRFDNLLTFQEAVEANRYWLLAMSVAIKLPEGEE